MILGAATFLSKPAGADGAVNPAATVLVVLLGGSGLFTLRRIYAAVDKVIGAVENVTVDLVELAGNKSASIMNVAGDHGVMAVQLFGAIVITLLLLMFRNLASRLSYSRKESMTSQG